MSHMEDIQTLDTEEPSNKKNTQMKRSGRKTGVKKSNSLEVAVPGVQKKAPKKRGPPRPHKKLQQEVLETRVNKLQNRIDRATEQLQEAKRHIAGYHREIEFRQADALQNPGLIAQ